MNRTKSRFLALTAAIISVPFTSSAALTVQKVVPFATDQVVRVQVTVQSDVAEPATIEGKIVLASDPSAPGLWQGSLGSASVAPGTSTTVEQTIRGLQPKPWTPGAPNLYNLVVTAKQGSQTAAAKPVRFGFRSVTSKDGQVLLNGKPIFLKGIAINPPGRDVPDEVGFSRQYAHDYVRYLRSQNVNLIRMNFTFEVDERQQHWFDACDEFGMLVYQGCYGAPPGQGTKGPSFDPEEQQDAFAGKDPNAPRSAKSAPPANFDASANAYINVFATYARHPSVIIYVLSNELPGPVGSKPEWHDFLTRMDARINQWDPSRLIIGNAGYGLGKEGDINDVHRYWGWYYNSFLTYYNLRDTVSLFGSSTDKQPFTFSECVGSFTSPFGPFNAIFRKQLAPQLGWTGHSGEQAKEALAYQAFMVKHALESFRTMREQNHRIAGLMPFTILFFNWEGIKSFAEMKPKPAMEQMGVSYTPVLTNIELWTPQVFAGREIRPIIHIVNDAEDFSDLAGAKLHLELLGADNKAVWKQGFEAPAVKYFEARANAVPIKVPQVPTGDYLLTARLEKDGRVISRNQESIYIRDAQSNNASPESLHVYDPRGTTIQALKSLGFNPVAVGNLATLPAGASALVIGENAFSGAAVPATLKQFVGGGGRILCLAHDGDKFDTSWLPAKVRMLEGTATDPTYTPKIRPTADQQNVNPERPWHPIFAGIGRERLRLWSDYSGWDQSKPGFPKVYPVTHGFKFTEESDLAKVAILADYDRGLEGIAIAEMFDGKGSVVFTGLDIINRVAIDPVAGDMLRNLANYLRAKEHELHPLIEKPIVWGDYPTERGVLTGPIHGLVYNCRWVAPPTSPDMNPVPDNTGAWNTKPGNPFLPKGIRPFGPYSWSTGASPREDSKLPTGSGLFFCRVPAGKTTVVTKVENTQKSPQNLEVSVNGSPTQSSAVPAGSTVTVRTPIAAGTTDLSIRYSGNKLLVIHETAFE